MFINYLKIAARNIKRQKGYSFINIFGLTVGIACCILLLLWVKDELSFEQNHKQLKNLYRVEQDQRTGQGTYHVIVTPTALGPALLENFPEIKNMTRWVDVGTLLLKYNDKLFYESGVYAVEPAVFRMFTFPFIKGNPASALLDPGSIVISEKVARKYFGNDDPIGKMLVMNNTSPMRVTGVMKDHPLNSNIRPQFFISYKRLEDKGILPLNWRSNQIRTWIELNNNVNTAELNGKITRLVAETRGQDRSRFSSEQERRKSLIDPDAKFMLFNLGDINLYGTIGFGSVYGKIQIVKIFIAIAVFILLIAGINYMNLSTARSANRALEVGLRKTVGASRRDLIIQFYSESFLLVLISIVLALFLVLLLLPLFNDLSEKEFTVLSMFQWSFLPGLLAVVVCTGLISGSYPALFLSSFRPIKVLQGKLVSGTKRGVFRKALVIGQFSFTVLLIIGTIVIFEQLQFMRKKNLGYDKENLLYFSLPRKINPSYDAFLDELAKDTRISSLTASNDPPTNCSSNASGAKWEGKDPNTDPLISISQVRYNYPETMNIKLVGGRTFSPEYPSDSINGFLINESLQKLMGPGSAVGKKLVFAGVDGQIIGVMADYHYWPVNEKIEPIALTFTNKPSYIIVRLRSGDIPSSIAVLKSVWHKYLPDYPFNYYFVDDDLASVYKADERMASIFTYATMLAIAIACLGLFGLTSFITEQRTKEIGIRKVLGASVSELLLLLSGEFIQWVLWANIIAWPAAYFLIDKWLQNYAYRMKPGIWIYLFAGASAILAALITVSYQAVKAALTNPAKSLKYE